MKVLITRSTAVKGIHRGEGEICDLSDGDANELIKRNRAREATAEDEAPACPPTPPPVAETPKPKAKKVKPILEEVQENGAE